MENILIGIEILYGVYKSHFGRFWRQVILGLEIRFITSGVTGRPDDNFKYSPLQLLQSKLHHKSKYFSRLSLIMKRLNSEVSENVK